MVVAGEDFRLAQADREDGTGFERLTGEVQEVRGCGRGWEESVEGEEV